MIAAVLAMFASRHVAGGTLTVRQSPSAGGPVAGSSRWCATPPSVAHAARSCSRWPARRTAARSTGRARRRRSGGRRSRGRASRRRGPARQSRDHRRARPARRSPPRRCAAGGGSVGRQRLGGRAQVEAHAAGHAHRAGLGVELDRVPAGDRDVGSGAATAAPTEREVAVVAERDQRLADRGIDVAVGQPRRAQRAAIASSSIGPTAPAAPAAALTVDSSESSRKREQARSNASTTS